MNSCQRGVKLAIHRDVGDWGRRGASAGQGRNRLFIDLTARSGATLRAGGGHGARNKSMQVGQASTPLQEYRSASPMTRAAMLSPGRRGLVPRTTVTAEPPVRRASAPGSSDRADTAFACRCQGGATSGGPPADRSSEANYALSRRPAYQSSYPFSVMAI